MIFPPGYIERNLKKCISVCFAAFQLYVLETTPHPYSGRLFQPHPNSSQPVFYSKQHPCLPVLKFIPDHIPGHPQNVHFNLTVLGTTQCRPKLAGNFKPVDRRTSWQDGEHSEWKLQAATLTTTDFLALSKVRESPRGCSPEPPGFMELGPRPSEGDFLLPLICIDLCIYLHKQTPESQQ